jgi:hypothetical protein
VVGPGVGMEPRTPQNFRKGVLFEADLSFCVFVPAVRGMVRCFMHRSRSWGKSKSKRDS